ncbi:YggT family protein [Natranaerobius thermophilus]|uniref:YggT family protein n=1 Tax=Natranaerobius thermophilus (strain ATCC BAA-1301 / DSM 18059 / JW/NM-WN-LF) TaxID=457570 RepID=B2A6K8_NATTJ|nr:YggT family protein [Natranaerobius thermophilus]ACB85541.1 protein of unknown function YGGT [Natranaerobius thermophilus JW/NM-WN-LF]
MLLFVAFRILYFLFLFRIIFSFIGGNFSPDSTVYQIGEAIYQITEPILAPIRSIVPPIGGTMDISPLIALFIIRIIQGLLIGTL